jgi:periodic tryptophan protein 1
VALENGLVLNFDARTLPNDLNSPSPASFTIQAHDGAVSAIDINPHIRGCVATGGTDKFVKVWNVVENENVEGKPNVSLVTSRDLGVVSFPVQYISLLRSHSFLFQGKVFSTVFSPDDTLTLAAAGSKAKLQIWDVGANFSARNVFAAKLAEAGRNINDKEGRAGVVGIESDEEDDGDEPDDS